MEIKKAKTGQFGIITENKNGVIKQIGLTEEESKMLELFLSSISKVSPLVELPKEYDLTVLNKSDNKSDKEKHCYIIQQIKVKGNRWLGTVGTVFTSLEKAQDYLQRIGKEHDLTFSTENYIDKGYSNVDNFARTETGMINFQIIKKELD